MHANRNLCQVMHWMLTIPIYLEFDKASFNMYTAEKVWILIFHGDTRRLRRAAVVQGQHRLKLRGAEASGEDHRGGLVYCHQKVAVFAPLQPSRPFN